MADQQTALVCGGAGYLGAEVVKQLLAAGFAVTSADFNASATATNNVQLKGESLEGDAAIINSSLEFDAIVCVAGGWQAGSIAAPSVLASVDKMLKFNVHSSVLTANVASKRLKEGGLLVLTGASAALDTTPMSIGYGISKAAVHQLVQSLGKPNSKMPTNSTTIGILPITIDTPNNRSTMPKADFTTWTPVSDIAGKVVEWAKGANRQPSGSLVEVKTKDNATTWIPLTITVTRLE